MTVCICLSDARGIIPLAADDIMQSVAARWLPGRQTQDKDQDHMFTYMSKHTHVHTCAHAIETEGPPS